MTCRLTHPRLRDQRGFTLIELLVVILIIGILAAIALPAFMNQRTKAQDVDAKSTVRNARTTLETYHTDRSMYDAPVAELIDLEPMLANAPNLTTTGTNTTFKISVDSKAADGGGTYTIELDSTGNVTRTCSKPGKGSCRLTADPAGNLW
jgi:type IV pilus assembly protein PilA